MGVMEKEKHILAAKRAVCALILFLSCPALLCCGSKKPSAPPPNWLCQDAPRADHEYFYGTGCAQYQISNRVFQRRTAHERARKDLARTIHEYAVKELSGDTTRARRVVESVLSERRVMGTYMDEEGNFCARAGLSRRHVEEAIVGAKQGERSP